MSPAGAPTPEPVLGLPADRAATLLPADLIQGDEIIVLLLKPSLWFILLGCLEPIVALGLVVAVGYIVEGLPGVPRYDPNRLLALGLILIAVRVTWQFMVWLSHVYVLTDRRVVTVKGFLRPMVFEAKLGALTHTNLVISLRERPVGLGSIVFATAGTASPESSWLMLRRPLAVHRKIVQTINRYRK